MSQNLLRCIMAAAGAASAGSDLDSRTLAYLNAASLPTTGGFAEAINTYVLALAAAGVFTTDDEHYILANNSAAGAVINLINPTQSLTPTSSPVFTQYLGFTGDGTADYLTTPTNLDELSHFQDESASFGIAIGGTTEASTSIDAGSASGALLFASTSSSVPDAYFGINGAVRNVGGEPELSPAIASSGYFIQSLNNISTIMGCYQNGVKFISNQGATYDPTTAPAEPVTLLGIPAFMSFSTRTLGLFHLGGAINDGQATARAAAWAQLVTDLGNL